MITSKPEDDGFKHKRQNCQVRTRAGPTVPRYSRGTGLDPVPKNGKRTRILFLCQFSNRSRHVATGQRNEGRTGSSFVRGNICELHLFTKAKFSRRPPKTIVFMPYYE